MGLVYHLTNSLYRSQNPYIFRRDSNKLVSVYTSIQRGLFSTELYKDHKKLVENDRIHAVEWDYMQTTQL